VQAPCEDLSRTGQIGAEEATDTQVKLHWYGRPREIGQSAAIVAVDTLNILATERAGSLGLRGCEHKGQVISGEDELIELEGGCVG